MSQKGSGDTLGGGTLALVWSREGGFGGNVETFPQTLRAVDANKPDICQVSCYLPCFWRGRGGDMSGGVTDTSVGEGDM